MQGKPETIDEYLARVPRDRRAALEQLRRTILSILPNAEECISYSMPAFRHQGHVVAGFLATSKGCSYFPFSGTTLATLESDVRAYSQTKSALHFDPSRPLSKALVKKLLAVRVAEEAARPSAKTVARRAATVSTKATSGGATKRASAGKRAAVAKRTAAPAKRKASPAKRKTSPAKRKTQRAPG